MASASTRAALPSGLTDAEAESLFDDPQTPQNRARHPETCKGSHERKRCAALHSASTPCEGHITKYELSDGTFECTCFESGNPPRIFSMYCPKHVLDSEP